MNNKLSRFWENNRIFTLSFLIGIPLFMLIFSVAFYVTGIRINVTRSFPIGFYRTYKGEPERGDLVFLKPPENEVVEWGRKSRAISRSGMFKRVYGVEGDEVRVSEDGISINGVWIENSIIIKAMPDGEPIPSIAEDSIVPENNVWVMSEYNEMRFDSRYFGAVPTGNIYAKAKPLWVW